MEPSKHPGMDKVVAQAMKKVISGKAMSPLPKVRENPMARSGGTLVPLGKKGSKA